LINSSAVVVPMMPAPMTAIFIKTYFVYQFPADDKPL